MFDIMKWGIIKSDSHTKPRLQVFVQHSAGYEELELLSSLLWSGSDSDSD